MGIEDSELPTKAVDNSVDYGCANGLSVGFYYRFVKLINFESAELEIKNQ